MYRPIVPRVRLLAFILTAFAAGTAQTTAPPDLSRLDVEDLMNIRVTSVSKREQSLSHTAAAVFVINSEDIRRSGATNIPDLLRMAPGVNVEQIDANAWAISVRGFNARYSNKVLVLIDGRTVYTPAFSGVYWEHLDMPLENIERIEIIRGPGGSVWGANAVNGVISIFTKSAKDTTGGLATAGGGSQVYALGTAQVGARAGTNGAYRVFGKYFNTGSTAMPDGSKANDHWARLHAGFRADWDLGNRDSLMVQGSAFANEANQTRRSGFVPTPFDRFFNQDVDATGGDLLARWTHTLASGSQTSLQTYVDSYRRTDFGVPEVLRTFDVDFQHHAYVGANHDIVWGLAHRVSRSALAPGYALSFMPPSRTNNLSSGFLQDEIHLSDSVWLTVGAKLEHNSHTGWQLEPSARVAWTPSNRQTLWVSASRALRQPSRADTDMQTDLQTIPLGEDAVQITRLFGNPQIKNEELRDFGFGYRAEISKSLSIDGASFLSFYRNLGSLEPQPVTVEYGPPAVYLIPVQFRNQANAVTYGAELSLRWNAGSRWRVTPGYSYLHANVTHDPLWPGRPTITLDTGFPSHTAQLRSSLNLMRRMEFDQSLYYTARLPGGQIPGRARLDLRLARHLGESVEISVVGQDLLHARTMEHGDSWGIVATQVVRRVYGQVTWKF